jgi:hypothetical protein
MWVLLPIDVSQYVDVTLLRKFAIGHSTLIHLPVSQFETRVPLRSLVGWCTVISFKLNNM